jgi:hypothetical protein
MARQSRTMIRRAGLAALAAVLVFSSCATLGDMAAVLSNLKRLQFRIAGVRDFRVAGVALSGKSKLGDFTAGEALTLLQSFRSQSLAADFVLDVLAVNPNDGTGGSPRTFSTLTSLESRLLIDGRPTVTGDIERPIEIPGTGEAATIPIRLSLDVFKFFGDKGYKDIVNLVLALGGANRSPSRLSLDAQPRVTTPLGPITYPRRITIVAAEFR